MFLLFLVKLITKELIGYEGQLLKGYKIYLTNLEKMASSLHKKKGDTRVITNVSIFILIIIIGLVTSIYQMILFKNNILSFFKLQ